MTATRAACSNTRLEIELDTIDDRARAARSSSSILHHMAVVVQKYGGSSVADVERLRHVAGRVVRTRQAGHDVVVVVSAMGDTTDDLLAMAKKVSSSPDRRELDMLL